MQFEKLTKRNAKEFFDLYMACKGPVLEELQQRYLQDTGMTLDFSPESLTPLWRWAYPQFSFADKHPEMEHQPIWYLPEYINEPNFGGKPHTILGIFLRDSLAYYFGDVLVKHLDLHWECYMTPKTSYSYRPIINGKTATYPLRVVGNILSRAVKKSAHHSDDALLNLYRVFEEDVQNYDKNHHAQKITSQDQKSSTMTQSTIIGDDQRETFFEIGFPPPRDEAIKIEVSTPGEVELSIAEWAESYLGSSLFESLERKISEINGVTDIYQEGRELFVIKTTLGANEIENEVWKVFLTLSEAVHQQLVAG